MWLRDSLLCQLKQMQIGVLSIVSDALVCASPAAIGATSHRTKGSALAGRSRLLRQFANAAVAQGERRSAHDRVVSDCPSQQHGVDS